MDNPRHIVVVGCLVRNDSGEVLLVRHRKRGWELPQGRMEEGEDLITALHREVHEETGVTIESAILACVWSKLSPPAALICTFIARHGAGVPRPSEETPEAGWFPTDEALARVTHPVTRDRLLALLDFGGTVKFHAYTTSPYQVHTTDRPE
ncbi:NUDIX hydrolase [Geomobilimonas luticola]|uniref:NUDIX hydrolase n=1 Tax=Geomobilimonas luticola TaxID=1114878 RepID=A0ABS5SHX3_9BACT|nr:NUDIX hydrolase [Geomobilimonas luticola]MBT0654377.1 NUDIX hydrolase [Geomobilimonas luticola]